MDNSSKLIKYNILWNSIGSFSYLFLQWLITILIARLMGFNNAGIFSLAMSTSNIFICISLFGVRNFQVSDVKNQYSDSNYIIFRIITCIASVLMCLIYVVIQSYSVIQCVSIVIYMIYRSFEAYVDVLHGIDQKMWRMDIIGKSFLLRGTTMFIAALFAMLYIKNIIVLIFLITIATTTIIILYDVKKTNHFIIYSNQPRGAIILLLKDCLPLAIYWLMSNAMGAIPRIFMENIDGSNLLGIYSSISSPTVIIQVLSTYIFSPFIGLFAKQLSENDKKGFLRLFGKILIILFIISLGSIIGAILLGNWALRLLFGKKILSYVYLLLPIVLCAILTAFSWFLCMIMTIIRDISDLIISNLVGFLLIISLSSYFIKRYGMNGTSYVTIFSFAVQILLLLLFIFKYFVYNWKTEK